MAASCRTSLGSHVAAWSLSTRAAVTLALASGFVFAPTQARATPSSPAKPPHAAPLEPASTSEEPENIAPNRFSAPSRPQINSAIVTGLCALGHPDSLWSDSAWCNGLRADVLFGRARNDDFALGPYAHVTSSGFWDARYGAGLSWLIPLSGDFPLIVSAGLGGHELEAVALEGWLFFGSRTYNFHSSYSLSAGLLLGVQRDLGAEERSQLVMAAQIDGLILFLPFLLVSQALR